MLKIICKVVLSASCGILVGLSVPTHGRTLFRWSFDGSVGSALTSCTDTVAGIPLTMFKDSSLPAGAANVIRYGPANPWYNTNGTSAEFLNTAGINDPGVALFRNDAGVNEPLDLVTASNLTIEAFVYPYDLRQAVIIRKTASNANGYLIDIRPSGYFGFRLNTTEVVVATGPITANAWYHVALVKDAKAGQARFYINGVNKTNVALAGFLPDSPNGFGVGAIIRDNANPPGNSGQFFRGLIDEVRISDAALTPGEFLFNQNSTSPPPAGIATIQKTETFDSSASAGGHGWLELDTRVNGQDYGFSPTANCGSSPGEAGGTMSRKAVRSSYCDVFGGPITLSHAISGSGTIVLSELPGSGNASVLYGHGDSSKVGLNNEANQMGIVLATTPPSFFSHITFADGFRWETSIMAGLVTNQVYWWDYHYDPSANGGFGRFTARVTAVGSGVTNTSTRDLDETLRARGGAFDSFGITQRGLSDINPTPVSGSFMDDVTYTAVTNAPSVQFAVLASSVFETSGSAALTVNLSQACSQTVSVQYAVTGGEATGGGVDYTLTNGMLMFPPGITNQDIVVPIVADNLPEMNETVEITLSNPVGAGLGDRSRHILTILNADRLALTITNIGHNLLLSWPVSFWNFHLQFRSDLSQSTAWINLTNRATASNSLRQVVMPWDGRGGLFRLARNSGPLPSFTNSIGMKMIQIPAGTFTMGYWQSTSLPAEVLDVADWVPDRGDFDERPAHSVTVSRPFWMSAYEVSNWEFEQFDPSHALWRGHLGFSTNDDEAVVYVSWDDANAFCRWLSQREGRTYRLPTEAEWEYACRAGTTTHFSTGDTLPAEYLNNPGFSWWPSAGSPTELYRGKTPPNPWGLYDMHGNVEEWCSDWYGPYEGAAQTDPVGREDGLAKVTRGGSHSTVAFYLRSENRMGTLPEDKSWYIGLRVVAAKLPASTPLPKVLPADYQKNVTQAVPAGITNGPDPAQPYFSGPLKYVKIANGSYGPLYSGHNHDAGGIIECPNGDLLAMWYTCVTETGRELALAASRLRYGHTSWDDASPFYDMPDRNDHAPCLGFDGDKTIYCFDGLSAAATWGSLALTLQTSTNNGATWSRPRIISPEHTIWHQPIASFIKTTSGALMLTSDAGTGGSGGSVVWISHDNGQTWINPAVGRPTPSFTQGNSGAWIAGIHAAIAERSDGSLIAFGRGNSIAGKMPKSISTDGGTNWTYSASTFDPIGGGQRATMLHLHEGPLFLASFSSHLEITDSSGATRTVSGLFAALSYDDGETWPYVRLVSDDGPGSPVETTDGAIFTMGFSKAEPHGYLASTQGRNGIIHLISSRECSGFNLKWLETRPPSAPVSR